MDPEEDRMTNGVEMSTRGRLQELLQLAHNSLCADCNEPLPTWASTNWGAFICAQCAGVHR